MVILSKKSTVSDFWKKVGRNRKNKSPQNIHKHPIRENNSSRNDNCTL